MKRARLEDVPLLYQTRKTVRVGTAGLLLLLSAGCQSFRTPASFARVRVVDLSADAGPVDVYEGNNAVAYNLTYGTVTSYVTALPGSSSLTVDVAGSRQVLASTKGTFRAGGLYTVLVNHSAASLQPMVLADAPVASAAGVPSVRLIHQAARMGAVDVYLVPAGRRLPSVTPIVTNLAPGASTGYLPVPASVCTAVVLPAGTVPTASTVAVHLGAQIDYATGTARSLILLDTAPLEPLGLQVLATVDGEPGN